MAALIAIAVHCARDCRVPNWAHLPFQERWQGVSATMANSGQPALIFLASKPSLDLAAHPPANWRYVGASGDFDLSASSSSSLASQLREYLSGPGLRLRAAFSDRPTGSSLAIFASYGLSLTDRCQSISLDDDAFKLCDLERGGR